jgi:F-type H+-transporting ATPase subunit delta
MPATTKQTHAAGEYARAIFDLANEQQQAEAIGEELLALKQIVQANPMFAAFLRDPAIGADERRRMIDQAFHGRISPLLMNTLGVMNRKGRLSLLVEIADEYKLMLDEQLGNVEVKVTVVHEMDGQMLDEVRNRVSAVFKKNAVVRQIVDESIIGGMVLQIEDRLIDGSVRTQLEAMKKELLAAAPK